MPKKFICAQQWQRFTTGHATIYIILLVCANAYPLSSLARHNSLRKKGYELYM